MPITVSIAPTASTADPIPRIMYRSTVGLRNEPTIPSEELQRVLFPIFKRNTPTSGIVVAGGMASHIYRPYTLATKSNLRPSKCGDHGYLSVPDENASPAFRTDVDVFAYGKTDREMVELIHELSGKQFVSRHRGVFEWIRYGWKWQFIFRRFASIDSIFEAFDLDCSQIAFDDKNWYFSESGKKAYDTRMITIDWEARERCGGPKLYDYRLAKYVNRGFGVYLGSPDAKMTCGSDWIRIVNDERKITLHTKDGVAIEFVSAGPVLQLARGIFDPQVLEERKEVTSGQRFNVRDSWTTASSLCDATARLGCLKVGADYNKMWQYWVTQELDDDVLRMLIAEWTDQALSDGKPLEKVGTVPSDALARHYTLFSDWLHGNRFKMAVPAYRRFCQAYAGDLPELPVSIGGPLNPR